MAKEKVNVYFYVVIVAIVAMVALTVSFSGVTTKQQASENTNTFGDAAWRSSETCAGPTCFCGPNFTSITTMNSCADVDKCHCRCEKGVGGIQSAGSCQKLEIA